MPTPSIDQLKRAIAIQELIDKLEAELKAVLSGTVSTAAPGQSSPVTKPAKKKRKMSSAGRARISAAAKKRWADLKAHKAPAPIQPAPAVKAPTATKEKTKRVISPEGRAKMAAAAKKRWAKAKKK